MTPRPIPQPAFPTRARATLPARIGTLALAFLFAAFVLLLWGAMRDTAHAEEAVEAAPLVASPDESGADPAPAEVVAPPEPETAAEPTEAVVTAAPVEEAEPPPSAPVVVDEPVEAPVAAVVVVDEPVEAEPEPVVVEAIVPKAVLHPVTKRVEIALVAPPAVHQCNADTFPTGAGWEASCVVTVENTVGNDGATSSTVTTTWCLAEAGVLPPEGCDSDIVTNDQLVTTIDQCNGILAGGSNVTCSVEVINNVPFGTPTTGVTVNQCIGSGQGGVSPGGPPTDCDPVDSSTTGATVTQCNGSANGGGAPERVQCSVVGSVTAVPVTVNQCNGSTAAGSTVTCDVTFTNNFAAAVVVPDLTPDIEPTPVATTSSSPVDDDSARTLTSRSGSSSRSSSRSGETATGTATDTGRTTSLAVTGASLTTLLMAALMLLLLGCLLLAAPRLLED